MKAVAIVGNPRPASRTRDAAERLAASLGASCDVIEVGELGPGLLAWGDPAVRAAVATAADADVVIAASPTYKATYTGLLKLFLDQVDGGTGLAEVVGIPLMLGAGPSHALAPELLLKPVLVELGATCPAPGLYQLDRTYDTDTTLSDWIARWGETVHHSIRKA